VPHGENIESVTCEIKVIGYWDQLEAIPKILATLSDLRTGHTKYLMQSGHQAGGDKEFYQTLLFESDTKEQTFKAPNMVKMGMGYENRIKLEFSCSY